MHEFAYCSMYKYSHLCLYIYIYFLTKVREREMESREMKGRQKKGFWKAEEDLILKKYVETHGEGNWTIVSKKSGLMRGAKSCRLRWKNYLRPNIKRGIMSEDERDLILRLHKLLGNRWSLIAGRLPGRTDNEVKNYWNTHLNKKPQTPHLVLDSPPPQQQNLEAASGKGGEMQSSTWLENLKMSGDYGMIMNNMAPHPDYYSSFFHNDDAFLDNLVMLEPFGCGVDQTIFL